MAKTIKKDKDLKEKKDAKIKDSGKKQAAGKKDNGEKKTAKKVEREQIVDKLKDALSDLKLTLGKKKFKSRVKQAGRLLASGKKKGR